MKPTIIETVFTTDTEEPDMTLAEMLKKEGREEGWASGIAEGREEGLATGIEKGKAEGQKSERAAVVMALRQSGMTPERIAESTPYSIEEVRRILDGE